MKGKIIKGIAGFYYVHDGVSRVYACRAKGIFRSRGIKPVVGDDVEIRVLDEESREGSLEEIYPRRNVLIRPAASNVDQALVIFAVTCPEPNLNLLDRFLITMNMQQIPVTICFNKTDLGQKKRIGEYRRIYEPAGYPLVFVSTYEQTGIDEIKDLLRNRTTILAGPSGVGKSSLTNLLLPEAAMETGSISEKIQRGKHTTRHAELFCLEPNTFLCDTPGFSSLYLEHLSAQALKDHFPEFEPYADNCRFQTGCVHMEEPACGVKQALEQGNISRSRYENYRLFYEELKQKEKRRY